MTYVDAVYYNNTYKDIVIPAEELERQLNQAEDHIDSLTFNRIPALGFDNLTDFQQENIRKAVCKQADFIYEYGDYLTMPIGGYSAGSVSLSFKAVESGGGIKTSDDVINLLKSTGLTSRRL